MEAVSQKVEKEEAKIHNTKTNIKMAQEFDTSSLLETFPEEIWSTVLTNINKATDYHRLSTSASLFQNLFHEQRVVILFPDVFGTLTKWNANKNWKWKSCGEERNMKQHYLNDHVQELANLRLVCRSWKLGVDRTMQNLPYQFLFQDEQHDLKSNFYGGLDSYYITTFGMQEDQIEKFENQFELLKPNLRTLEIFGITLATTDDLSVLQRSNLDFSMTKLRLSANPLNVPWADLFACVEKRFGKNLTELHLGLGEASPKFLLKDRLKLPNLKNLNIKFERVEQLDFLLDTKATLETLVVKVKDSKDMKRVKTEEREIKLFRHFKMLHKSNVWNIFPKMKEVTLLSSYCGGTCWSCTKEQWKAWKGEQ